MTYLSRGVRRDEWGGTQNELVELSKLKELAVIEYKEEVFNLLGLPPIGKYKKARQSARRKHRVVGGFCVFVALSAVIVRAYLLP